MASVTAMIRGLAVRNAAVISASKRTITSPGLRSVINNIGVRGFAKTIPQRTIRHNTADSVIKTTIQQRTKVAYTRSKQTSLRILQQIRSRLFHTTRAGRSQASPTPNPTPSLGSPNENLSLGQRMRKLSREYGWSALGVYLALTALDFPFCYLLVRYLGTDRIGTPAFLHFAIVFSSR